MLPPFDHNGYLPPGIYEAALYEIERRYVYNRTRKWLFEGLKKLVKTLKSAGCKTLYLNGSYITDKKEPGDYDAVWEYPGVNNTIDPLLRDELDKALIKRKYGCDIFCQMPGARDYIGYFQTDRKEVRKGIIKIDLEKLHGKTHH